MSNEGDIGFKLEGDLARRIRALKKETNQSASKLAKTALEYFIPAIQRGEFAIINGKLVPTPAGTTKEALATT